MFNYASITPEITVFDPAGRFRIDLADMESHKAFLLKNVSDSSDPYQAFIRYYFGLDAPDPDRRTTSLNRYSLNIELLRQMIPNHGSWVDLGAFGHDALRLRQVKPLNSVQCFSYTGTAVALNDAGLHYATHGVTGDTIAMKALDLERDALPIETASCDVVSAFETIEHFKFGPQNFVTEANRVLKPGGILLISTPNITSARSAVSIFRAESPGECRVYHRSLEFGRVHPLEYDYSQIYTLFTGNGFDVEWLVSLSLSPMTEEENHIIRAAASFKEAFPAGIHAGHFGTNWYAAFRKTSNPESFSYSASMFE